MKETFSKTNLLKELVGETILNKILGTVSDKLKEQENNKNGPSADSVEMGTGGLEL